MKSILLAFILISSSSLVFAQNKKPSLKITGDVKEIAMQEIYPNKESAFYITYIKLNLKLENTGSVPVIFLQPNPLVKDAEVITDDNGNKTVLSRTLGATSSFLMDANKWEKLKTSLNKSTPPRKETRIVNPNEIIEFEGFVRLNIPRFKAETDLFSAGYSLTLDSLQKHSPANINLELETWSTLTLVINGKSRESKKKDFAKELKKKWENIGYLWTDEIVAEPISIDFNSVIFKTLID